MIETKKKGHSDKRLKKRRKKKPLEKPLLGIIDFFVAITLTIIIILIFFSLFFPIKSVKGISMTPLLKPNEKLITTRFAQKIDRFDVISIKSGEKEETKRIIGLPGERLRYSDDSLYVNEKLVEEYFLTNQLNDYHQKGEVFTQSLKGENSFHLETIPKDYYFVLGDNRPDACDSRQFGLIHKDVIKGKGLFSLSSFSAIN